MSIKYVLFNKIDLSTSQKTKAIDIYSFLESNNLDRLTASAHRLTLKGKSLRTRKI
ncbi:hypothetical protein AABL85_15840 [Myroides odoratimimus]